MGQGWVFWSAGAVSAGAVEPFGCVSAGRVLAGQWSAGRPEIDTTHWVYSVKNSRPVLPLDAKRLAK